MRERVREREPVVAEFGAPEPAAAAARRLRELGYAKLEAYGPFPFPELEAALGLRRPRLPLLVFGGGLTGAIAALYTLHWTNAVDYRLDVGGRPFDSWPADIPIAFELTVLFASFAAFFSALLLSGLPRLHHRVFDLEGFERTSIDRFWLTIGDARTVGDDVAADEIAVLRAELDACGALRVRGLEEAP